MLYWKTWNWLKLGFCWPESFNVNINCLKSFVWTLIVSPFTCTSSNGLNKALHVTNVYQKHYHLVSFLMVFVDLCLFLNHLFLQCKKSIYTISKKKSISQSTVAQSGNQSQWVQQRNNLEILLTPIGWSVDCFLSIKKVRIRVNRRFDESNIIRTTFDFS